MDSVEAFEGFVLAGGESSRMGKDKAGLVLGGQTFIERIALELAAVTSAVTIVSSKRAGGGEGFNLSGRILPVIPDVFKGWGALGGLHAALAATRADWVLVVACDLPFVTRDLFLHLAGRRGDHDAVAPLQEDQRPQPLCAFYRTAGCREISDRLIKAGERRPVSLLQSVRTAWIGFKELADLNGASRFFENVNTPEDYARAQQRGGSVLVL